MSAPAKRGTPVALTIAGSDSGGGAGIQADLKAFARCGVHGTCAITAITAQNTVGVQAIHPVPPEIVLAQVRAVIRDIGVDAVKVGMLGTAQLTLAVASALDELPPSTPIVVDPVMIAESGARLLDQDAQSALITEIVPRASVLTPNVPEAQVLTGLDATRQNKPAKKNKPIAEGKGHTPISEREMTESEAEDLARAVLALGPGAVVLTGGHRASAVDLFIDSTSSDKHPKAIQIPGKRHPDGAAHGSGCTHSAVLAAQLAQGHSPLQAARTARARAGEAVANGLRDIGAGAGPVDILDLARIRNG